MRVAFFLGDSSDAAVARRLLQMKDAGVTPIVFCFSRQRYQVRCPSRWAEVRLGDLEDGKYFRRIWSIGRALGKIIHHKAWLKKCARVYVRNLDMAWTALITLRVLRLRTPLTYEVLDIAPVLSRRDFLGGTARWLERRLLRRCDEVVVSSYGYVEGYFRKIQGYYGQYRVIENRLEPYQVRHVGRPQVRHRIHQNAPKVWRLGWYGTLKSEEDLVTLCDVATALAGRVEIVLRGITNRIGEERFFSIIENVKFVRFKGPFDAMTDLAEIYRSIDIMWCADFGCDTLNGRLLLPNRIYEAGFFGVPVIALDDTYTARFVRNRAMGWLLRDKSKKSVVELLTSLSVTEYNDRVRSILGCSEKDFCDTGDFGALVRNWRGDAVENAKC